MVKIYLRNVNVVTWNLTNRPEQKETQKHWQEAEGFKAKAKCRDKKKEKKTWTVYEIIYWKHNSVVIDGWNPVANAKKPSR